MISLDTLLLESNGSIKNTFNPSIPYLYDLNTKKLNSITTMLDSIYWVKLDTLNKNEPWFQNLTCKPQSKQGELESFQVWYEHPLGFIGLPKFYGLSLFGKPKRDARTNGIQANFKFLCTFQLRDYQLLCIEKTIEKLEEWGGSTIIADCGAGKTAMSLNIVSKLNRKTLIICNRVFLMEQWKSEIYKLLPDSNIGWLQGTEENSSTHKYDIHKNIVVASIESLSRCKHKKEDLDSFGVIIIDEMHHLAAKTLSQVLSKFKASKILGVTATPERNDGLEHLLYWLVGPVSFVYKRLPEITGVANKIQIEKKIFTIHLPNEMPFTNIMKFISNNKNRNEFIINEISFLKERKKILITTLYIEHGKTLLQNLENLYPSKCIFLHGGVKQNCIDFAKSQDCKYVVATYQYMEEGYDDPTLDTLILSLPRSKVQQVIGRCERSHEGKLNPFIIDIVDSLPICQGMFRKRLKFYKERSFQIL